MKPDLDLNQDFRTSARVFSLDDLALAKSGQAGQLLPCNPQTASQTHTANMNKPADLSRH